MLERVATLRERTSLGDSEGMDEPWLEVVEDAELVGAMGELADLQHWLGRAYPGTQQFKKFRVPEKGRRTILLGCSGLRQEVRFDDKEVADLKEDEDGYAAWAADWALPCQIPEEMRLENEKACNEWMQPDDAEEEDVPFEWSDCATEMDQEGQFSATTNDSNSSECADATSGETIFEPRTDGERPPDSRISINAVLEQSDDAAVSQDSTHPSQPTAERPDPAIEINTVPSNSNKENTSPAAENKTNPLPPHLRRRKGFMLQQKTALDSSNLDVDLFDYMRCWNYRWITVRS